MMMSLVSVIVILLLMLSFYVTLLFKGFSIRNPSYVVSLSTTEEHLIRLIEMLYGLNSVKSGISCKMTNMIKLIYNDVRSCVRMLSSSGINYSEFFNVTVGVQQWEQLSPLLFILFSNDVCNSLDTDKLTDKDNILLSMYMLLFADAIVLFTTDHVSLQAQLNSLYEYSMKWGLKINVNKSKVCVYEKRKVNRNIKFYINNE